MKLILLILKDEDKLDDLIIKLTEEKINLFSNTEAVKNVTTKESYIEFFKKYGFME